MAEISEKHLSNEEFFARLGELFETLRKHEHGSVFLSQKPFTFGVAAPSNADPGAHEVPKNTPPSEPIPIIVRATNGKSKDKKSGKVKLSTIILPDGLESFYIKYAEVCKTGMSTLKKRDRSKVKKKLKARKKKVVATGGSEDGNGHK